MSVMHGNHPLSDKAVTPLARAIKKFVDETIIPHEPELAQGDAGAIRTMEQLMKAARAAGLWGWFYPAALGGKIATLVDYLPIAEQEGRSEYGPAIFGSSSVLDVRMLHQHGSAAVGAQFLDPLVAGAVVAAYGMSEPDSNGSIPATIKTSAVLSNGSWIINGSKWFVSRVQRAAFITLVARTRDAAAGKQPAESAFSMIVVPTDAPGFKIERQLDIFGRNQGQGEISLHQVAVPEHHLLGPRERGLDLMRQRLELGRTLNAMHWTGLAQRCFDLMCARICSQRGQRARLPEKQLARRHVVEIYQAIASARAQVYLAAERIDAQCTSGNSGNSMIEVSMGKLAASRALSMAVDAAIQMFGAEGLTELTPLSSIYRSARATHIQDGADEVLISAAGKRILDAYQTRHPPAYWPESAA